MSQWIIILKICLLVLDNARFFVPDRTAVQRRNGARSTTRPMDPSSVFIQDKRTRICVIIGSCGGTLSMSGWRGVKFPLERDIPQQMSTLDVKE